MRSYLVELFLFLFTIGGSLFLYYVLAHSGLFGRVVKGFQDNPSESTDDALASLDSAERNTSNVESNLLAASKRTEGDLGRLKKRRTPKRVDPEDRVSANDIS